MSETPNKTQVDAVKNFAIAEYVTCLPALLLWAALLSRILVTKVNLHVLSLICVLMILYQIIIITCAQYNWIVIKKSNEGDGKHAYGTVD